MPIIALYPGTFDPITNGHRDIIMRATRLFDEVVVAVAKNATKATMFSLAERVELAQAVLADVAGVRVIGFSGLLIHCVREAGAKTTLRRLRAVSDFEYEFQMAAMNRRLDPEIETVFLTPAENYTFTSASLVKEIATYGGDVSQFVDPRVMAALEKKLR